MNASTELSHWLVVQGILLVSFAAIISGMQGLIYKDSPFVKGTYEMNSWIEIFIGIMGITMLILLWLGFGHW